MNISEFAQIAGVSKSAVSRYFNEGYLSEDKRLRIEKAVAETGYSPSISARSIRTRITKLVGVILPKLSSESCARITEGISEILDSEGYELLLVNTANNSEKEVRSLELFRQNRVDGVIFLASVISKLHYSMLKKMRVPVIIVGQNFKGCSCVCHNDKGAAYALTKLMLDKGAVNPAIIGVTQDDPAAGRARNEGFMKALEERGVRLNPRFNRIAQFTMDSGYDNARIMLRGDERPDCIFCATDTIAAGAMLYCREIGIRIPDDIMISSIGDGKISKVTSIPLTTAHLHYKTAGKEAAQMLLSAMFGKDTVNRVLQLDYEIIERRSTEK